MGLDSVELLVDVEKYFDIQLQSSEAEKIATIQDMADAVAIHLQIPPGSALLRNRVFARVADALVKTGYLESVTMLHSLAGCLSQEDKAQWQAFVKAIELEVPEPSVTEWKTLSLGLLTDAICMANYTTLIDRTHISSRYEIYVVVGGITVVNIGVSYYEIAPEKSFTSDLGVD